VAHQVDDPVLGDAGASVESGLLAAVQREARVGDLHDQRRAGRMRVRIVAKAPRYHAGIGLGLRLLVEGNRELPADIPAR
jgi:hypothetical protein